MHYICDRFGFVSEFYQDMSYEGEPITRVRHSMDLRDALPFKNRGEAEKAYRKTYLARWWHCVVSSLDQAAMIES